MSAHHPNLVIPRGGRAIGSGAGAGYSTLLPPQARVGKVRKFMSASSSAYSVPSIDESGIYQTQWTGGPAATQPAGGGIGGSGAGGASASSPGFQVDSDGIRAQAAILAQCGEQISQVLTNLRAALGSGGEPWGTDDMGQKFGAGYTSPANQGFASVAGLGAALTNVANELAAQADTYDAVEQQIADSFGKVTGPDGGSAGSTGSARSAGSAAAVA